MGTRKEAQRNDSADARAEAAEDSSAVQPTHYHSRMESSADEGQASEPGIVRDGDGVRDNISGDVRNNIRNDARGAARRGVRAQPPEEFTGGEIREAKEVAGGLPAVWESLKHTSREMGLLRGARTLLRLNQKDGFDCPGCAWPDPDGERSHAEFCENGAKAVAEEATVRRVTPEFFREWSVADLSQKSDYWLGKQGRITHPAVLRRGATHYELIDWDEAFKFLAEELNALDSPDEAAFYTSGRTSNEAAFLYQLFVRQFGTNNLPDCSNMCHESSGRALTETIGVGKGTVTLEDFRKASAIFVVGQNPGTCHPRMLTSLQAAKQRGCRIVHINPLPETGLRRFKHPQHPLDLLGSGTQLSDIFLQVRVNGDVPLLKGIMKEVLEEEERRPGEVLDRQFIEEKTHGFEEFARRLGEVGWDELIEQSGVAREEMREAARVFIESPRTIVCWAMGLTQHKNAVANIQEIVNLLLLRGQLGKPGAGACPVRGHSNVQGDRTMGIWERPTEVFLDALAREFDFEPPRRHGLDTVETIRAMHSAQVHVFFALGGNFLSATPDTEFTAEALRRCRLTAHVSTKLNRAHLVTGEQALILPCLGRTERDLQKTGEQFVSVENSMGVVHSSRGSLEPASPQLLSEPAIIARLARATLGERSAINWESVVEDYDRVRDLIGRVIPGFDDYNSRVRRPGGFYLPNLAREGTFETSTGKANFTVHPLPRHELAPGQLLMMTMRSHDQFNTTIYGLDDRYRGVMGERRVVFLNPLDVREQGLSAGQVVDLVGHFEGEERIARRFIVVPYRIPRRCAATYFPEANVLVPVRSVADKSNTPASKSVVISLRPSDAPLRFDYDHVDGR
ncbi:MAG TPA: FdhF/YdeP family oxidoreductase [Pyrinomonadaceae bacterium]|jgi:molybdopterin-dependent oxidoreductase alpha subunit|nr:FdhF/YdeP family oxidoreductase [Pyrinomonadaceae bacterium]